jgi:hypothetical protein
MRYTETSCSATAENGTRILTGLPATPFISPTCRRPEVPKGINGANISEAPPSRTPDTRRQASIRRPAGGAECVICDSDHRRGRG